ncbi:hypothetical protein LCGC14_1102160 [marine sediment metagenome]|uniref:Uncharacterized protein n=1 Tax=marine sediment metagenome TaxID=412755 RepID=A0A0F9MX21_9ZZZZ
MSSGFEHMTDRELLIKLATEAESMRIDIREMKNHSAEQNGFINDIKQEQLIQRGAILAARWIGVALIGIMTIGIGVASVILATVM